MKQLLKLGKNKFFRIAVFSLGCLITIIGIVSGLYAFIQLPEGISEFMPYLIVAWLTLWAGINLCILAIKMPKYLEAPRKMSKEERIIENLKRYMNQRRQRLAAFTFLLILVLFFSMLIFWQEIKLNETVTPENIRKMASFENAERELPTLFLRFSMFAVSKAYLKIGELFFGLCTGFVIYMLVGEFIGFTRKKHILTLSMWERIQQLENEVKELKAHTSRTINE